MTSKRSVRSVLRLKRLRAVAAVLLCLALLLPVGVWLTLKSPAARKSLIQLAARSLESSTGLAATAEDFSLSLRDARLDLKGLQVAAESGSSRPFLTAERVVVETSWTDLLSSPRTLHSLVVEAPSLDLGAPLPGAGDPPAEKPAGDEGGQLEILELSLHDGAISGARIPERASIWAEKWGAKDLRLTGSFVDESIVVATSSGRLVIESERRPDVELSLAGGATLVGGRLSVQALELESAALRLTADAFVPLADGGDLEVDYALDARLGDLFPDLELGGRARSTGILALELGDEPRVNGSATLEMTDFPAVLLEPWLEAFREGDLDATGTSLDVRGTLAGSVPLDGAGVSAEPLAGDVRLVWRRGDEELLTSTVQVLEAGQAHEIRLGVEAALLPANPGSRRLEGVLAADRWHELPLGGRLEETVLHLDLPRLDELRGKMGISAAGLDGWLPVGSLVATARATGPLKRPDIAIDAVWDVDGETQARIALSGRPGLTVDRDPGLDLAIEVDALPEFEGERRLEAQVHLPDWTHPDGGLILSANLYTEVPDLSTFVDEILHRLPALFPHRYPLGTDVDPLLNRAAEVLSGTVTSHIEAQGPILSPAIVADGSWRLAADEHVRWSLRGETSVERPYFQPSEASELAVVGLDLVRLESLLPPVGEDEVTRWRPLAGRLDGTITARALGPAADVEIAVSGVELRAGELGSWRQLRLDARLEGSQLSLDEVLAEWQPSSAAALGETTLAASGWLEITHPVSGGRVDLELERPVQGAESVIASAMIDDQGRVTLEATSGDLGRFTATAPLGVVSAVSGTLGGLLPAPTEGQVEVAVEGVDIARWQALVEGVAAGEEQLVRMAGSADGRLRLDPKRPGLASGRLSLRDLSWQVGEDRIEVDEGLEIVMDAGRLEVPQTLWQIRGERATAPVDFSVRVDLSPSWRRGDPAVNLIERLDAGLEGTVDSLILNPFLSGGTASGLVVVDAEVHGSPDDLTAALRLTGPKARILFPITYPTLIEAPTFSVVMRDGAWSLDEGRFRLNGGEVEVSLAELEGGGFRLGALVTGARYRLDHGLLAELAGDLSLTLPGEGRKRLSGRVTVERGALRRDLILEQEILRLAGQQSFALAEESVLSEVDLNLDILTLDGIWIRNNLADIRLDWSLLRARGTAASPVISGRIDVDSGGILTAYGQTVRIDEASLVFSGDPDVPPRLELETTSSLEDPRLQQNQGNFWATGMGEQGPGMGGLWDSWYRQGNDQVGGEDVATGLTTHYGNLFAENLVDGLDRVQLSFQPLPVIGETDTQARLTVAYHVSPQMTLYTSQNPRQAEGRTEVLDLSGFEIRPSLRAQVFSNDENRSGLTLQEVVQLGGSGPPRDEAPRLRKIRVDLPTSRARRRVRRSLEFGKGDPFPEGSVIHVEVDAIEALRLRGFPEASVEVGTAPASERRIDLEIGVIPGTAVRYEFVGESLPRRVRRTVRAMYQPVEVDRGASLREMKSEIERTLRARGHLHPEVEIGIEPDEAADLTMVTITSRGGTVVDPGLPRFPDLASEDDAEVARRFSSRLARVELAADRPGARAFLAQALRGMGFSQAEIQSVELAEDGVELIVRLDPGSRDLIASVEIEGMSEDEALPVLDRLGVLAGEPVRSGRLTQVALSLEDQLRDRGYLEAGVEVTSAPMGDGASGRRTVLIVAKLGARSTVGEITLEGLRASRPSWIRKKLELNDGELLTEEDLQHARRNLSRTGAFHRIGISLDDPQPEGEGRALTLDLEERPRYLIGIGARWQEDRGLGVIVDAVDRHFLGLGQTFGVRAFYSQDEKRLRFFHAMPLRKGKTLEFFLEALKEKDPLLDDLETEGVEFWTQLSFPLTDRTNSRLYGVLRRRKFLQEGFDEGLIPAEDNTPYLGWQILFDTRGGDPANQPAHNWGLFYGHDIIAFTKALGGEADGLGLFTQLKLDLPVMSFGKEPTSAKTLSWVQAYRLGWLEAFEGQLPIVDRLRAGGEYSVRGYPTDSLGPVSPDGLPLGGEFMIIVNQELHLPLRPRWAGLVFFDAGNVWLTRNEFEPTFFKSVGVGLRFASPVGPLRLDWAFPLDRREGDPRSKVYVGFGPTF